MTKPDLKELRERAATSDLIDRLRGIYRIPITDGLGAVGAGEEPENANEFVRRFDTPPIQHEAADALDTERERRESAERAVNLFLTYDKSDMSDVDCMLAYADAIAAARAHQQRFGGKTDADN